MGKADASEGVKVKVNPKIYPLDVIYSAAYVFLDRFYVVLDGDPEKEVIVSIFPKESADTSNAEKEFHSQLLNYAFYKKQVEKNAEIRKAMIQRALITAELSVEQQDQDAPDMEELESSDADFIDDPEGIAIPWEEKFGKKAGKGGGKDAKSD